MPRTVHALALVSALCSAGATILIRQGLRGRGPYTGFWINLVVGTVGLWAAVLLTGGFGHPSAAGVAFFVLPGLIGTVARRGRVTETAPHEHGGPERSEEHTSELPSRPQV